MNAEQCTRWSDLNSTFCTAFVTRRSPTSLQTALAGWSFLSPEQQKHQQGNIWINYPIYMDKLLVLHKAVVYPVFWEALATAKMRFFQLERVQIRGVRWFPISDSSLLQKKEKGFHFLILKKEIKWGHGRGLEKHNWHGAGSEGMISHYFSLDRTMGHSVKPSGCRSQTNEKNHCHIVPNCIAGHNILLFYKILICLDAQSINKFWKLLDRFLEGKVC